jgi:abhydrolase domain-containing protein 6
MLIDFLHSQIHRRYLQLGFNDGFIECGRFRLHAYERYTDDSIGTLVLIHGLGTSSSTWIRIVPRLDKAWNVLALDLPGFGFSKINSGSLFANLEEMNQSVATLITQKVSHPCALLGHSLGGWLAARYAIVHPETIRLLILVDNAGILCDETLEQGRAFQVESVADLRVLLDKIWRRYPWYFKPFYRAVLKDLRKRRVANFVQSIHAEDFLNDRLNRLTMNVSVVWGKQDGLISLSSAEILKQAIGHAQIHLIDRCGHVPQLERPKEFAEVLRNILRQQTRVATI